MKGLVICLALGALPTFAGGREGSRGATVTLYTEFQQPPPDSVLDGIQEELEAVMPPAGLYFGWHPLADAGGRVTVQLAIVHFKGACAAAGLRPESGFPGPLGWTHISDGEIIPFIDINCDGIRIFVQSDLLCVPAAGREKAFGRALARVLAHELYHLLGNTRAHASRGLAKASYSVGELLGQTFHFGRKEYELLRSRAAHLGLQAAAEGQ
jgi:hypothetical protein